MSSKNLKIIFLTHSGTCCSAMIIGPKFRILIRNFSLARPID